MSFHDSTQFLTAFEELLKVAKNSHRAPSRAVEAFFYTLLLPGKRIRPYLSYLSCKELGVAWEPFSDFACAIEYMHAASLIHDDLPALDNDDVRRGVPTCHIVYGEDKALLAGDWGVSAAFRLVAESMRTPSSGKTPLLGLLAQTFMDLCEGQSLDLEETQMVKEGSWESISADEKLNRVLRRHSLKTGALIKAALLGPALAENRGRSTESIAKVGETIGLIFQITDDLLDAEEESHTPTVLTVLGEAESRELLDELRAKAEETLESLKLGQFLIPLIHQIAERKQ